MRIKNTKDKARLQFFYPDGRIYIPKDIRKHFEDCAFFIQIEDGKLVLDPIKIKE